MKIIVDAYGGDNAPLEILKGTADAIKEFNISALITGNENEIKNILKENNISSENMEFCNTNTIITNDHDPGLIVKDKKDSSLGKGLTLLKDGKGDAFVTAGSTGATLMGATLIVKRIKGIKRAALSPIIPTSVGGKLLIDCGANVVCTANFLNQFAIMGSMYMKKMMNISSPKVALINNGTEESKGDALRIETYALLKEAPINFVGNLEARDLPLGKADVFVADGFTGNMVLKSMEGMGLGIMGELKKMFTKNFKTKIAALMLKDGIKSLKKSMDYKEYGGAPLLGIQKPVIKAHGSSDARSFKSALKQAKDFYEKDVIKLIEQEIIENNN